MDVGLNIVEGIASGGVAINTPAKRNIGLLGQFLRGASFSPTKITSLDDFRVIFGGHSSSFFGPAFVKAIFDEAGNIPVNLYIARVVGKDAKPAKGTVSLSGGATMSATASYRGVEDTGVWGNGVELTLYSFDSKTKGNFTLEIRYKGFKEQYHQPSLAEIQLAVNKVSKFASVQFSKEIEKGTKSNLTGTVTTNTAHNRVTGVGTQFSSELAVGSVIYNDADKVIGTVASITSDTQLTLVGRAFVEVSASAIKKREDVEYSLTLENGADGDVQESDFYPETDISASKGLACFDGFDVQILACTEFHSLSMAKVLNNYVNEKRNPIGIINLPLNADEGTAELYALELSTPNQSFLAGYMGWCKVATPNGGSMLIPSIASILGSAYLRTPYTQGDHIHIPPGGIDSLFNSVIEVVPQRLSQSTINKLVQQFSCNIIQYVENVGYYVGSSRTYSTNPLYSSIHIRLQTSYYLRALNASMRFLEQKPHSPELRQSALNKLRFFFKGEYDNGALERSVPFDVAYTGICDLTNNPPTQDRKLMNVEVLYIPVECTESIRIALMRNDGVLTTYEK